LHWEYSGTFRAVPAQSWEAKSEIGEAVQNAGETLPWRQGTPAAAHPPADALRVLRADEPPG
jgi:hypothetical protein